MTYFLLLLFHTLSLCSICLSGSSEHSFTALLFKTFVLLTFFSVSIFYKAYLLDIVVLFSFANLRLLALHSKLLNCGGPVLSFSSILILFPSGVSYPIFHRVAQLIALHQLGGEIWILWERLNIIDKTPWCT